MHVGLEVRIGLSIPSSPFIILIFASFTTYNLLVATIGENSTPFFRNWFLVRAKRLFSPHACIFISPCMVSLIGFGNLGVLLVWEQKGKRVCGRFELRQV